MDLKALKLSKPMETMIREARFDGKGMLVAGPSNTMVALINRDLVTAGSTNYLNDSGCEAFTALTGSEARKAVTAEDHPTTDMITVDDAERESLTGACVTFYSGDVLDADAEVTSTTVLMQGTVTRIDERHRLVIETSEGEIVRLMMQAVRVIAEPVTADHDARINAREAAIEADNARLHALYYEDETHELPGDAERIWDAENAAMEGASIRAEYEHESNSVNDFVNAELDMAMMLVEFAKQETATDVMVRLPRGNCVSMAYLNTMRRIHAERVAGYDRWKTVQYSMIADRANLFALIDGVLATGGITFGHADREKRRIRNITRPTLGPKRKPSKSRRNRH